jgi:hypothetical protein
MEKEPNVQPEVVSSSIAAFAVIVSIVGLYLSWRSGKRQRDLAKQIADRQEALTKENEWRQDVGAAQWRRDLRDWASQAIDVLSKAIYDASVANPDASPSDFREYLSQFWALIDRGRFFLPNRWPEERKEDPVAAFQGYRHGALDPLWAAGNLLENRIDATLREDAVRYRRYVLEELQREFVSRVSAILNPVMHNQQIAQALRDSEKELERQGKSTWQIQDSEQQVSTLDSEEIPSGDKALLRDVVLRVARRQTSRQSND